MCQAFLWYYPKQNFDLCISQYPDDAQFRELGVTNWNRSDPAVDGGLYKYTIIDPTELAGDYLDVLSTRFQWNETFVRNYEPRRRYGVHKSICMAKYGEDEINVQFPDDFVKYIPADVCKKVIDPPIWRFCHY
ncbi:hypothetical protein Ocin01_17741 [Orchesella cincta]|uniref:Uncharacterized protein n=1 Tax=Orchesella cincta TaxID=48709 RepID=A0A1D2M7H2_ORCCI|nr:hypothetical protein Ocin01_17741 [Orchesella cincta]